MIRPSSAHRWLNCPGSVLAEQDLPEEVSEAAEEGTAAHWVAEKVLAIETPVVGALAPNGVEVTQEMIDGAKEYADYINSLETPVSMKFIEKNVTIDRVYPGLNGTADCIVYDGDETIHVIDYKFGWDLVDERNNPQLNLYSIGAIDMLANLPPTTKVVQTIIQPRAWCNRGTIRSQSITAAMLLMIATQYNELARLALSDNPIRFSGPHCKHCLARSNCPALIGATYNAIDFACHANGNDPTVNDLSLLIRQLRTGKKRIDTLLEAMEAVAIAKSESGEAIPGYTLDSGRGSKKWNVPDQQVVNIGIAMNVDLRNPKPITPTQAEKVIDPDLIKSYVKYHPGSTNLVELDDHIAVMAFSKPTE